MKEECPHSTAAVAGGQLPAPGPLPTALLLGRVASGV